MYHYLNGKLIEKNPAYVILDVNGVGYHVYTPVSTFGSLPELGKDVKLLTHFVVREDAHLLFGFGSEEERDLFRMLISVSGIGPKTAMTVLSGVSLPDFRRAIIEGNLVVLTGVPGIGRKTAERMVVELREKMVVDEHKGSATGKIQASQALVDDGIRALIELGYKKQNAQDAVQKVLKNHSGGGLSVSDLVRASLKYV